ncbi:hypothetical protein [Paludifilum halophilum]|uniref:Uncharacterized protein n=1 Tax=Paludifilum halophilum TaxID=1642702 RepID=A0A235B2A1_9BACL|nr:hypothetical protein [Paludifilum halophilum]OYD06079.1 hypothetical protein CHM34_18215 [Paludifilum halophilum]
MDYPVVGIVVDYKGYKGTFAIKVSNLVKGVHALERACHLLKAGEMENILSGPVEDPDDELLNPLLLLTNDKGETVMASPYMIGDFIVGTTLLSKEEIKGQIKANQHSHSTGWFQRLKEAFGQGG